MIVCSYGGGTNSTAMLIGMVERGERCDLILFADTGGEKPNTYEHIAEFSQWLKAAGMPEIIMVKGSQPLQIVDGGLEGELLRRKALPAIAYGFKTCSQKWKAEPIDRYLRDMGATDVTILIGFDSDEPHRAKPYEGKRYPLIEWGWGRDECIAAIKRAGLKLPGKSACFFCPSSKKHEILTLKRDYPDLAARAVAMENNAELTTIKGLGRDFAWRDLLAWNEAQLDMFPHESRIEIDCGCYDEALA
jgi:hypothetical protein